MAGLDDSDGSIFGHDDGEFFPEDLVHEELCDDQWADSMHIILGHGVEDAKCSQNGASSGSLPSHIFRASQDVMNDSPPRCLSAPSASSSSVALPLPHTPSPRHGPVSDTMTPVKLPVTSAPADMKRRRMREKSSPSAVAILGEPAAAVTVEELGVHGTLGVFPTEAEWAKMNRRTQYRFVYEQVRLSWTRGSHVGDAGAVKGGNYREARKAFSSLDQKSKRTAMMLWCEKNQIPSFILEFAEEIFPEANKKKVTLAGRTCLLTFVGPWGYKNKSGELVDLSSHSLDGLVEFLKADAGVQDLWSRFKVYVESLLKASEAADWACTLELCTKSFAAAGFAHLHFHCFLRSQKRMWLANSAALFFEGVRPNLAAIIGGVMQSKYCASWNGAFYCSARKIGQLWSEASKVPFRDYLVQGQWVMNMVQAQKLSVVTARQYILQSCHNVQRFLTDLDIVDKQDMLARIGQAKEAARRALLKVQRPFLRLKAVEKWVAQYAVIDFRYQFLVLEGPSKLAKTAYAQSLTPEGMDFLDINCASGQEPDLRQYRYGTHGLVLFDEVSPKQVAAQRKLFQASNSEVQLGCSTTNVYSYCVYVHMVRLVLCSNGWSEILQTMSSGDRDWVIANSIHVLVDRPLYEKV